MEIWGITSYRRTIRRNMQYLRTSSIMLALALLPSLAFAASQHKSVTLDQAASIGTQQLKAGTYNLKWDDSKDTTNVDIQKNGKTIATVPAHIVHKGTTDNASMEFNTSSGQNQLQRVYLSKEQLVFGDTSQNSANSQTTPPSQ